MRLLSVPPIVVVTLFTFPTNAQVFHNLDFSEQCDTCKTGLAHWSESWASAGVECRPSGDREKALVIANAKEGVGFVEQVADMNALTEAAILTVSAHVRTNAVIGKGAGLNIAVHDAEGTLVMNKDMGFGSFSWISGTQDRHAVTLKVLCPEGTTRIKLGAILYGQGEAWFDDYTATMTPLTGREADPASIAYVNAACDTIAAHSLHRGSIDLPALRKTALQVAGKDDPRDRLLAVEFLLASLGDHHSFLMKPEEVTAWEGDGPATAIEHAAHRMIDGCGYVSVPHFTSNDSALMAAFADTIQQALKGMESAGARGWIIDLRKNTGGNMGPMVCGLGPLFDPGTLGQLIDVNGKAEHWFYADGIYGWDGEEVMRAPRPVVLQHRLPIAVLWSQQTGSSGECTAISFIHNSNTRSFGQPTWGLTTGNSDFDLPDDAKMFLASTVMADRKGNTFNGPIEPDQIIEQPADWSHDASLQAALDWIAGKR